MEREDGKQNAEDATKKAANSSTASPAEASPATSVAAQRTIAGKKQVPNPSQASGRADKRASLKARIQRIFQTYFKQLTTGCGRQGCPVVGCSSHEGTPPLRKEEAAKQALSFVKHFGESRICPAVRLDAQPPLALASVTACMQACQAKGDFADVIAMVETRLTLTGLEQLCLTARTSQGSSVDMGDIHKLFEVLCGEEKVGEVLQRTIWKLTEDLAALAAPARGMDHLRRFLILFAYPGFEDMTNYESFSRLLHAVLRLSKPSQKVLREWFVEWTADKLHWLVGCLQQFVTIEWMKVDPEQTPEVPRVVRYAIHSLGLLYWASQHPVSNRSRTLEDLPLPVQHAPLEDLPLVQHAPFREEEHKAPVQPLHLPAVDRPDHPMVSPREPEAQQPRSIQEDLARLLGMNMPGGSREAPTLAESFGLGSEAEQQSARRRVAKERAEYRDENVMGRGAESVPFGHFYNDVVNMWLLEVPMQWQNFVHDYNSWKRGNFSFVPYSFVLDPAAKHQLLKADSKQVMLRQMRMSMFRQSDPFLIIEIDRHNLVQSTLQALMCKDGVEFQKQLRVKFLNEAGVDEGGVKKEFFQLLVEAIFDVNYGMFSFNEDTRTFWFSKDSFASKDEFELIGIILGLAIYNGVILNIQFPLVVYKKLLGYDPSFRDLKNTFPDIFASFEKLLAFEGDVEATFCLHFCIQHRTVELIRNGAGIPVTKANRLQYVQLYTRYLLEHSIEKQFTSFKEGFELVCGGTRDTKIPTIQFFRPEELEQVICGSPELDFLALEESTRYADGFRPNSRTMRNFWAVVHNYSIENKRRFLQFCTGSDRVPIRGLGKLRFTISRNGPDSDRLPTAHTCFNHLLLPDYRTKAKLEQLLTIAIMNSQGFGLI